MVSGSLFFIVTYIIPHDLSPRKLGYSLKDFYDESRRLMQAKEQEEGNTVSSIYLFMHYCHLSLYQVERDPWKDPPDPKEEADEIIEVIYQVSAITEAIAIERTKRQRCCYLLPLFFFNGFAMDCISSLFILCCPE
jgi:hypothetical protein